MIISVVGPIGYESALRLAKNHPDVMQEHFPRFFIRQLEDISSEVYELPKADYLRPIGEGGIFRTLWEAGEEFGCGMEIELQTIPIRQEVIEVLELFDESPYECSSKGSFLIISGEILEGVKAIGRTTQAKKRILKDGDSERFLTPPARQNKDIRDRKSRTKQVVT
ncbi:MAG: hypothetical protein ACOX75_02190 [Lachnospiraceae bacterium]|jgi:hydrogenase expression/formation protein HypE